MRIGPATFLALVLAATALLPGMALAQDDHAGHGAEGPANPMVKAPTLYLDASGGLVTAAPGPGAVPAGPALPDGTSEAVLWSVAATRNTRLDSSIYVELYARVTEPTLVAGGPEGAAFEVALTHNGEPVEGTASLQKSLTGLVTPGEPVRMKLFLPQPELTLAPGDTFGLAVRFFGVNPEGHPTVEYVLGGEQGSRMVFRLRMASLDELDLPQDQVGAGVVAPLEGFDFREASKKDASVKEFTLKAFQFGFSGGPLVVQNNSRVVIHLTVDETLATSPEGHDAHAHGGGNASWDQNVVAALHGFGLPDFGVQTVEFDGLVTTVAFTPDKVGNFTYLCTVFCGSGHGAMADVLTVQPAPGEVPLGANTSGETTLGGPAATPGFEAAALLAALGAVAAALRRR